MQKVLTTADVSPRDRLAYWHDVACKVFVDHECRLDGPKSFSATIHHASFDQLEISRVESDGLRESTRSARGIPHGEDNVFFLCAQLSGTSIMSQDGRDDAMGPGDFMLMDAQRTSTNFFPGPYGLLIIKIPHRGMKARLASSSQLTACTISGATGIGALTSEFIRMIPERLGDLTPTARSQVGEQVLDLLALALATERGEDRPALSSARAIALLRLRTAVERHLSDPGLDPATAAAAAGISVRYANALLAEEGLSIQRLIVHRRLERCRLALSDAKQSHRTIGDIAFSWGFSDLSHFTRRFKSVFACTPGDYRKQQRM
jgi:AraC family transcriptional regulator, positive regulator of tynA and feaB